MLPTEGGLRCPCPLRSKLHPRAVTGKAQKRHPPPSPSASAWEAEGSRLAAREEATQGWGWWVAPSTGLAGPGFSVLGVLLAPVGPQRHSALCLGQSRRQRSQVGGGASESAAPAGFRGTLQPEPRAAPPARACCSAHPARPHQ